MREKELRERSICSVCDRPIGHTGLPLFWTVRIERHSIKMSAVRRQDGLAALFGGNARLAQVMGTDAEMTESMFEPITVTVCEACAVGEICLAQLAERNSEKPNGELIGIDHANEIDYSAEVYGEMRDGILHSRKE